MQWALWSHKDPRERTFQQPILALDLAWKNSRGEESLAGFLTVTVLEAEELCTSTDAQSTVQMGCYYNCTMSCYWKSHGLLPSDHHKETCSPPPPTCTHTRATYTDTLLQICTISAQWNKQLPVPSRLSSFAVHLAAYLSGGFSWWWQLPLPSCLEPYCRSLVMEWSTQRTMGS